MKKHVAAGSILRKISCCIWGNQELFFICPSKVQVIVKNELYHVKKNHSNVSKIIIFAENSLDSLSPLGKKSRRNQQAPGLFRF